MINEHLLKLADLIIKSYDNRPYYQIAGKSWDKGYGLCPIMSVAVFLNMPYSLIHYGIPMAVSHIAVNTEIDLYNPIYTSGHKTLATLIVQMNDCEHLTYQEIAKRLKLMAV